MPLDDAFLSRLQVTITELRYWAPSIAGAAAVEEGEGDAHWRLRVAPFLEDACAFELILRTDGLFDLEIAGEEYAERKIETLDLFAPLVVAIAQGRVRQRVYFSRLTALFHATETLADLGGGLIWRGSNEDIRPDDDWEWSDRVFLPYLREDATVFD